MDPMYFWKKYRVKSESIKIQYCPIDKMIVDFFYQNSIGIIVQEIQRFYHGQKHIYTLTSDSESLSSEEHVGNIFLGKEIMENYIPD